MQLGRFQLLFQRGAGWDGVVYRAVDQDGTPMEVRLLSGARLKEERWGPLLERLRECRLLQHPGAVRVLDFDSDNDPPYLAVDIGEGASLVYVAENKLPFPWQRAVTLVRDLADTCAEAHRLGLFHGHLEPGNIVVTKAGQPRLDFTSTEPIFDQPFQTGLAPWPTLPEEAASAAGDVHDLASVLAWLLTGKPTGDTLAIEIPTKVARELKAILEQARAKDPETRPTARQLHDRLDRLLTEKQDEEKAPDTDLQHTSFMVTDKLEAELLAARDGLVGRQLGRFLLRAKIGEGGMGAVYRGEDLAHQQTVAIKVLRPEMLDNPKWVRRFL